MQTSIEQMNITMNSIMLSLDKILLFANLGKYDHIMPADEITNIKNILTKAAQYAYCVQIILCPHAVHLIKPLYSSPSYFYKFYRFLTIE